MSQATVRFDLGAESVTVPLDINLPSGALLIGDVAGTFGDCFVAGDLNLTGNLFVEGLMTGVDTFHVQGNGFTIFFQNGGRADLHGKVKAAWGPWGTDATGWVTGDQLAIAPTKSGFFTPTMATWSDWSMSRPVNSPDMTLVDGRIFKPEVANLSQSIVFENLSRGFHIHDSGGIQLLSDVKFLNCGTAGVLGNYPHHFHMVGENARGSLLERVVVEGGKNHAFVPHASHGITYKDCVAVNTVGRAYWWDPPPGGNNNDPTNDSDDIVWDHCLAGGSVSSSIDNTAFQLGAGLRNRCTDSVAYGIMGGKQSSGFSWPEKGQGLWVMQDCLSHNNKEDGIFTWQNDDRLHVVERFTAYRCPRHGIEHGAYINRFQYLEASLTDCGYPVKSNGLSVGGASILFEDFVTNGKLMIATHNLSSGTPVVYRRCTFTGVDYFESAGHEGSFQKFEDCGAWCVPAAFNLGVGNVNIKANSQIEIWNGGVLAHRWAAGVWS